ncbi:hypothetical protein JD276_02285 [Leucobacter sp. CSA1]|uniref:Uncharacterized protein n=1 Tax=Leucobacter chromiisoli TaxID=2796471 RepID=A0A934Q582_9MICO|nr:hypothetical protein [Leucobacter chromiisoli]MBK0417863.1 hypothetical protein [Leucobacter chromiisoli]
MTPDNPVPGIDPRWSWADVIALHADRTRSFDDLDLSPALELFLGQPPRRERREVRGELRNRCGAPQAR